MMTRRAMLATAPALALVPAPSLSAVSTDTELLALGQRFEALFAVEEAARAAGRVTDDWNAWDKAYAATNAVVTDIERLDAHSLAGLRVKARCVQWCYGDDPVFHDTDSYTTDVRLAQQIVKHLLAIA